MAEQFHFLHPLWLLALVPLALLLWRLRRAVTTDNPWHRIIDAPLQALLLTGQQQRVNRPLLWLLGLGWLMATLALADPVWEKRPQPLFQTNSAQVIVLDLSRSMLDRDIKPSRLARARFKIEDILDRDEEGQTALVVFAGDAFTVTPLTRDVDTIRALLKALDPALMPIQGSRADLGLKKAAELLQQAGLSNGQVLLLADGVDGDKARDAAEQLHDQGYRVSVLGVGSANPEPLTTAQGQLLRSRDGQLILPALESAALEAVARAGGGHYRPLGSDDSDIDALLDNSTSMTSEQPIGSDLHGQTWHSRGPWLAVLLLPLAALAFRRGWLLSVAMLVGVLSTPQPAMAGDWDDLWQRPDQQASQALAQKEYERASQLAEDPLLRGAAEYRRGHYEQALAAYSQASGAVADYDRGNALARLGRYEEAIAAYDAALKSAPEMADAQANKAAVEALLRQQPPPENKDQSQHQSQNQSQGQPQDQPQDQPGDQPGDQKENRGSDGQQGDPSSQDKSAQPSAPSKSEKQSQTGESSPQEGSAESGQTPESQDQQTGQPDEVARENPAQNGSDKGDDDNNSFADAARALETARKQPPSGEPQPATRAPEPPPEHRPQAEAPRQSTQARQAARAEALDSEEQMAAEQWLRRIPDDPGGLLRRKFQYQYQQRPPREGTGSAQPW